MNKEIEHITTLVEEIKEKLKNNPNVSEEVAHPGNVLALYIACSDFVEFFDSLD